MGSNHARADERGGSRDLLFVFLSQRKGWEIPRRCAWVWFGVEKVVI
uniref:Uncharacterized protein n=1 Tax=Arundo donax TaxID=35708 RepID=A0A0A9AUE9_ARUDO